VNIRKFGSKIFHVHAKDALINRHLLAEYGLCHPGVAEHRFPGLGQSNWAEIIHALVRAGYDSDLNIEGWHDPVFRDHTAAAGEETSDPLAGWKLEEAGLLIGRRTLEQYVPANGYGVGKTGAATHQVCTPMDPECGTYRLT
jgi:sugar phosphate isomerase/epimerase